MLGGLGRLLGLIAVASYSGDAIDSSSSETISERWSYTYFVHEPYMTRWQEFSGFADSEGNLYWMKCYANYFVTGCSLRSTDRDGDLRFETSLGDGDARAVGVGINLVAGNVLVTSFRLGLVYANLSGRSTSDGSVLWTLRLNDALPGMIAREVGGIAHDRFGRLVVSAIGIDPPYGAHVSAVLSVSSGTGETIWKRAVPRLSPADDVVIGRSVVDEAGNAYFFERHYYGDRYRWLIASLDPNGERRFETQTDFGLGPIAVAHGRLVIWDPYHDFGELLDTTTGARIVRLPGLAEGTVLISHDLGFFIEKSTLPDPPAGVPGRAALAAFDLASGQIQWRFPLRNFEGRKAPLLTDGGNVLLIDKSTLLEISPQGELLQATRLGGLTEELTGSNALLIEGRWFGVSGPTVMAYDLPGAPGEARLGWNSRFGNAQHDNHPREK